MASVAEPTDDAGIVEKGKHGSESDLRLPDELAATYADRIDGWSRDAIKQSPLLIKSRVTGHKIHHDGYVQFVIDTVIPGRKEPIVSLRRFSEFEAFRDSLKEGIPKERASGIARWLPSMLGGKQSEVKSTTDGAHSPGHAVLAANEQLLVSLGYRPDAPSRVRRVAASREEPSNPFKVPTTVADRPSRWMIRDLPPKTWTSSTDSAFLKERASLLSQWIKEVAGIPFLVHFPACRDFLGLNEACIAQAEKTAAQRASGAGAAASSSDSSPQAGEDGAAQSDDDRHIHLPASPATAADASPGMSSAGSSDASRAGSASGTASGMSSSGFGAQGTADEAAADPAAGAAGASPAAEGEAVPVGTASGEEAAAGQGEEPQGAEAGTQSDDEQV